MRTTPLKVAAIAAALALTAGCGKKAPKELPPAPQEETTGEATTGDEDSSGGVGTEALPGSRAAFLAAVGMGGDRAGHRRGPCRRARHPRLQSRSRRPPRQRRQELSRRARHFAVADDGDQLRQGAAGGARLG
jgi:predicted small lipoprotein YifL